MENKYLSTPASPALNAVHHSFLLKNITSPSIFLKIKKDIPKVWHRVKISTRRYEQGLKKVEEKSLFYGLRFPISSINNIFIYSAFFQIMEKSVFT